METRRIKANNSHFDEILQEEDLGVVRLDVDRLDFLHRVDRLSRADDDQHRHVTGIGRLDVHVQTTDDDVIVQFQPDPMLIIREQGTS